MAKWDQKIEDQISFLVKDWLKNKGRSQIDLRESLQASSSRMSSLIEVLKKEYLLGGIPKVAQKLCSIENFWEKQEKLNSKNEKQPENDPFNQLDLLLEELEEDYKK